MNKKSIRYKFKHAHKYSPELFEAICERINDGMTILEACKVPTKINGKDMKVGQNTFNEWVRKNVDGCGDYYNNMRLLKIDNLFEEIITIADNVNEDKLAISKANTRISARRWYISKGNPKKYGDKIINEHSGPGGGPIQFADMSDDELDKKLLELMSKKDE